MNTRSTMHRPLRLMAATLVVALAAGLSPYAGAAPRDGAGPMMGGAGMPMMGGGRHLDRMLDDVKASADQRSQIKAIMDAARTDLKALHEAGRPLHEQLMQAFTQPNVDANTVEVLRQKMLAQHDQASKRMMQAMLESSRVLTPEQRQQLATRMAEHRAAMEQRHGQRPAR